MSNLFILYTAIANSILLCKQRLTHLRVQVLRRVIVQPNEIAQLEADTFMYQDKDKTQVVGLLKIGMI